MSVGAPGARYSVNTSGRRTSTVGLPGSGLSYRSSSGGGRARSNSGARRQPAYSAPAPARPKPGLLAARYEREFAKGLDAHARGDTAKALAHFRAASDADSHERAAGDDFFAGLIAAQTHDNETAVRYLEKVVAAPDMLPDELMLKYVPDGFTQIGVTDHVTVSVPFGTVCAVLVLAEVYQRDGRLDEAIGLLQQLHEISPEPAVTLSLCELLSAQKAWDEVVGVAAGTTNTDDPTLNIRLYQAVALQWQGMDDAAVEAYRDCLRSKKRDPELLKWARYDRGKLYLRLGKKAAGKRDLGAVYADDPNYRDVKELLAGARA